MENKLTRRTLLKALGYSSLGAALAPFPRLLFNEETMLTRPIPSTGEALPVVGLGTWKQFDVGSAALERQPLEEVLRLLAEKGGKVIDSSPMYGRSEQVLGELTAGTGFSESFFYATKVWTTGRQAGIDQMEASMLKMKRAKLDLMQVHNLVDWETHLETLRDWKSAGKIRYIGITHYTDSAHEDLEKIIKKEEIDFVQFNYSIRERNAEKRLLGAAKDNGVAVIINEPFASGALFRLVKDKPLPDWAADSDMNSWGQFFLKYILANPAVNCVIPGTSNPKHLVDNLSAAYGRLPDENTRVKMVEYVQNL